MGGVPTLRAPPPPGVGGEAQTGFVQSRGAGKGEPRLAELSHRPQFLSVILKVSGNC